MGWRHGNLLFLWIKKRLIPLGEFVLEPKRGFSP